MPLDGFPLSTKRLAQASCCFNKTKQSINVLNPQITKQKSCVMMLLINLAYPEWITIDCNRKFYIDIVCMASNKNLSDSNISYYKPLLKYCSERNILKNSSCFEFIYYLGHSITQGKHHQLQKHLTVEKMNQFQFVVSAIYSFPNILSTENGRIKIFFNIRYHNIIKFYVVNSTSDKIEGYFIKKTRVNIFSNITIYANMHQCKNGKIVGIQYVCDAVFDCGRNDLSDEEGCTCNTLRESRNKTCKYIHINGDQCINSFLFFGVLNLRCIMSEEVDHQERFLENENTIECQSKEKIHQSLKDDLVSDCGETSDDEVQLQNIYNKSKIYSCPQPHQIPCRNGHSRCFEIKDICVFRLNKHKHLIPCRTGEHMQQCEEFEYNKKYKCPGHYCLPYSYICNAEWDCPGGYDEYVEICQKQRECQNMFHCKNSQICIHIEDVCNSVDDCPLADDETMCNVPKTKCPEQCFCYNLTIQCTKVFFYTTMFFSENSYASLWISGTNITSLNFVKMFTEVKYLYLDNNRIESICGVLHGHKMLTIFYSNNNEVRDLSKFCICNLIAIKDINLSKNKIKHLHKQAIWKLTRLQFLNLVNNFLNNLEGSILSTLILLNITHNPFHLLKHNSFKSADINVIETDDYRICCIVLHSTSCYAFNPWYVSCSKLLPTLSMRILLTFVACIIILLNVLSIHLQLQSRSYSSFQIVILSVNFTDILCFCYLTILLIADFMYSDRFITKEVYWRSSILCLIIFIFAMIFSILSAVYLSLMSLCRTMLVIFPLNLTLKSNTFIVRILSILFIITTLFSIFVSLLYRRKYSTFPTSLCLPFIDPTSSIKLIQLITILITSFQILSSIFISINYAILLKQLKISHTDLGILSNKTMKNLILQVMVVTSSNLLCWLPSDIIYISSLFQSKYSTDLVIWTTIAVTPINSIINPVVFIVTTIKLSTFRKSHLLARS